MQAFDFGEALAQLGHEAAADAQSHGAVGVVTLGDDLGIEILYDLHYGVHHWEFEGEGDVVVNGLFYDLCVLEGFDGCLTVGDDETACAEFDSAEVADDNDKDVGEAVGVYLSEDGFAGCTRGFAVVVGAEVGTLCSQHIGITGMAGIVVTLLIFRHVLLDLLDRLNGQGKCKELTSLFRVSSFCDCRYGFVAVRHGLSCLGFPTNA